MKTTFNFTPTPALAERSLAALAPGERARVIDVDASTPAGVRLLDLGFLPGTEVRAVRRAPLRDPVLYELRGYRVCLRRADAARVRVEALGDASERAR